MLELKKTKNILCVVPCYNEAVNLPGLFKDVKDCGMLDVCDIFFIDDCSKDNSSELIKVQNFCFVRHEQNQGYGAAVKLAFDTAVKFKYDGLILFPGDHQRSGSDVLKLINLFNNQHLDVAVGSKFHINYKNRGPVGRILGNRIFSLMAKYGWGSTIDDVLSGFKVYRIDSVAPFYHMLPSGYPLDIIFSMYSSFQNFKAAEIPVNCRYDEHTSKMRSIILESIKMGLQVLAHFFYHYPIWSFKNKRQNPQTSSKTIKQNELN